MRHTNAYCALEGWCLVLDKFTLTYVSYRPWPVWKLLSKERVWQDRSKWVCQVSVWSGPSACTFRLTKLLNMNMSCQRCDIVFPLICVDMEGCRIEVCQINMWNCTVRLLLVLCFCTGLWIFANWQRIVRMKANVLTCRHKVSDQVDSTGGCISETLQYKVGRVVIRYSAVWNDHVRKSALSR